jgi:hypothetical protein
MALGEVDTPKAWRVGASLEHYHSERNHQGLSNVIPFPARAPPVTHGRVRVRKRLGGLLKFYERKAA